MSEPIFPLHEVVKDAELAAKEMARSKVTAQCPYPPMSDAAARWHATLQRYLLKYSVGETVDGGA